MSRLSERFGRVVIAPSLCAALVVFSFGACLDSPSGMVLDASGGTVSGCHVAVLQLRDDESDKPAKPTLSITTTSLFGEFTLPSLSAGTYLLIAIEALPGHDEPQDLHHAVEEIANGTMPEGLLVGRSLLHSNGRSSWTGLTIRLPNPPGQGLHVTGKLTGHFDPEHFVYEISMTDAAAQDPGSESVRFSALPSADGHFDFGWLPELKAPMLIAEAGPEPQARLFYAVDLGQDRLAPPECDPLDLRNQLDHGLELALPFHARVPIRVVGAPSFAFPDYPWINCWAPRAGGSGYVIVKESGAAAVLRQGGYLFQAKIRDTELVSPFQAVQIDEGQLPDEIVLELRKCPTWSTRIVDQDGRQLRRCWLKLGIKDSLGFEQPYPANLIVDDNGQAMVDLAPDVYTAKLDRGQQSVRFELDLREQRPEIVVDAEF